MAKDLTTAYPESVRPKRVGVHGFTYSPLTTRTTSSQQILVNASMTTFFSKLLYFSTRWLFKSDELDGLPPSESSVHFRVRCFEASVERSVIRTVDWKQVRGPALRTKHSESVELHQTETFEGRSTN